MIKIAYAEDNTLMRTGIIQLLNSYHEAFRFVIACRNGQQLISELSKIQDAYFPDLCLLDLNMPVVSGLQALPQITGRFPALPVLVLSSYEGEHVIIRALRNGAKGYITKEAEPEELYRAIQIVHAGDYYHPGISSDRIYRKNSHDNIAALTDKEIQFLRLCITEASYCEIGELMGISARTVQSYKNILCTKLGCTSRIGLVTYTLTSGLFIP